MANSSPRESTLMYYCVKMIMYLISVKNVCCVNIMYLVTAASHITHFCRQVTWTLTERQEHLIRNHGFILYNNQKSKYSVFISVTIHTALVLIMQSRKEKSLTGHRASGQQLSVDLSLNNERGLGNVANTCTHHDGLFHTQRLETAICVISAGTQL